MCLIAFAIGAEPDGALLIAANRDEYLDRPTAPLHRWQLPGGAAVVAGRDLRDGGTWLGVNATGRVAMLTNVRDAQPGAGQRSRGELPTRWLAGDLDWPALVASIDPRAYGGFNLVVGDVHSGVWAWLGNRHPERPHAGESSELHTQRLGPGVYGLSNATLDTAWPKTQRLKAAVAHAYHRSQAPASADHWLAPLSQALADEQRAAPADLPATGAPLALEHALSSAFVRLPQQAYGTRSSLVVHANPRVGRLSSTSTGSWQVNLHEWTHHPAAAPLGTSASEPQRPQTARGPATTNWSLEAARSETLVW